MGVDRDDAGHGPGCGRVDGGDPGMAIGRAQGGGVEFARDLDVVGEAPQPGEQADILDTLDRLADTELHTGFSARQARKPDR